MSIDSARIVCTGCDYETREMYRPFRVRYQTSSGEIVETGRFKGWCYDCAGYSDIEKMNRSKLHDELDSKERRRLEARRRQRELHRGLFAKFRHRSEKRRLESKIQWLDKDIAELSALLEIAKRRKSNARCLTCWSERTAPVTFDPETNIAYDFTHECGGHLQIIHDQSGPRFYFRMVTFVLNEEGEFLREEFHD